MDKCLVQSAQTPGRGGGWHLEAVGPIGAALDEQSSGLRPGAPHVRHQPQQVLVYLALPARSFRYSAFQCAPTKLPYG